MGRGEAGGLEYRTLDVAGVRRGYWLARGPGGPSGTLLVMLHGSGTSGKDAATIFTRLATRGPAAGVTAAFPDGWHGVWHIARPPPGEPALAPGVAGWILRRRGARHGELPSERRVAPVETVARDWAAGNGISRETAGSPLKMVCADSPPGVSGDTAGPPG